MRNTPHRISPQSYPIAAAATAPAYDIAAEETPPEMARVEAPVTGPDSAPLQRPLFAVPASVPRVIPFDSLATPAERESIRARGGEMHRPAPMKSAKVEVRHARARKPRSQDQGQFDFQGQGVLPPPASNIICDAPVSPAMLRVEAALLDGIVIAAACAPAVVLYLFKGGIVSLDKHLWPFYALALATIPLFYKLLWTLAGRDSFGMRCMHLRLVDFDGNPPSLAKRYQRFFASILSLLAAGTGLIWALVDEDALTWHDHISGTFPTIVSDE